MSTSISERIVIAAPCSVDWDSMPGDEKVRACGQCKQTVYNLSAMSETEAERFLTKAQTVPCLRFFRRHDGTIMFDNCPVGLRRVRDAVKQSLRIASVFLAWLISFSCAFAKDKKPTPEQHISFTWTLSENGPWGRTLATPPPTPPLAQLGVPDRISLYAEPSYKIRQHGTGDDAFGKALRYVDNNEYAMAEVEFKKILDPNLEFSASNDRMPPAVTDPQYLEFVAAEYGKLLRKTGREKEAAEVEERCKFEPKHVSMDIKSK